VIVKYPLGADSAGEKLRHLLVLSLAAILLLSGCVYPGSYGEKKKYGREREEIPREREEGRGLKERRAGASYGEINPSDFRTLAEIAALGKPIECEYFDRETNTKGRYYILGRNYRAEITSHGREIVVVFKDGEHYVKPPREAPVVDCDWIKVPKTETRMGGEEAKDPEEIYTDKIMRCFVSDFGEEMFETPGKICDIGEVMGRMIPPRRGR